MFHPFAFTGVCADEALDLQANIESFRNANTEIVFVSCDSSAARQAWREQLGAEYTFASDFWSHGAARAYGVFDEETGAPIRGTFLIDSGGTVIWSLVKESERRTAIVPDSLETLGAPGLTDPTRHVLAHNRHTVTSCGVACSQGARAPTGGRGPWRHRRAAAEALA